MTSRRSLLRSAAALPLIARPGFIWAQPRMLPPPISLRTFGCVGDGQTPDTVSAQAALEAAAKQGSELIVEPGTYLLGSPLSCSLAGGNSFSIQGKGQGVSRLLWSCPNGGLTVNYAGGNVWTTQASSLSMGSLSLMTQQLPTASGKALTINGNLQSGQDITKTFREVLPTTIRDMSVLGANAQTCQWGVGVALNAVAQSLVDNVTYVGIPNTQVGTGFQYYGTRTGVACIHTLRTNTTWVNIGVDINSYIQGIVIDASNLTAVNVGINAKGQLVNGTANIQQISVTDTQIAALGQCILMRACLDCSIKGGELMFDATAVGNTSLVAWDSCLRMTMTGNTIIGSSVTNGQAGITIANSLGLDQSPYPSVVSGNAFNNVQYGVDIFANASPGSVTYGPNAYGGVTTPVVDLGSRNMKIGNG
jgi:hypothetical protein